MYHDGDAQSSVFWDITACGPLKTADISAEHIAFIFSHDEWKKPV
jgi:hypothetical protein